MFASRGPRVILVFPPLIVGRHHRVPAELGHNAVELLFVLIPILLFGIDLHRAIVHDFVFLRGVDPASHPAI